MTADQHDTHTADLVECTCHLGGTKWLPKASLHFRPSVYAVVIHQNQLLVVTRLRTGKYFLPGGGVELGETLEAALHREVKEETGLEIEVGPLVGFEESFYYYDPDDVGFHGFLLFFHCTPMTFELSSADQVDDAVDGNPHWEDISALRAEHFQGHGELIVGLIAGITETSPP